MNSIPKQFQTTQIHFNKTLLTFVGQLFDVEDEDVNEVEAEQQRLLQTAYTKWENVFKVSPDTVNACTSMYKAMNPYHDMILARDERSLRYEDKAENDLIANVLDAPGIDSRVVYAQFEEEDETGHDSKGEFWKALIGMYRISILVCVYERTPMVKTVINAVLDGSEGTPGPEMAKKLLANVSKNTKLQKMLMKIMASSNDDEFREIFVSLRQILSTFTEESGGGAAESPAKEMFAKLNRVQTALESDDQKGLTDILASVGGMDPEMIRQLEESAGKLQIEEDEEEEEDEKSAPIVS